jgi:hypothetical protein
LTSLDTITVLTVNGRAISLESALKQLHAEGTLTFVNDVLRSAMIDQAAEGEGITVDVVELQHGADEFRRANGLFTAEATQAWLQGQHLSVDDLELRVERRIRAEKLKHRVTDARIETLDRGELDESTRATIRDSLFEAWLAEQASKADVAFNLLGELTGGK